MKSVIDYFHAQPNEVQQVVFQAKLTVIVL